MKNISDSLVSSAVKSCLSSHTKQAATAELLAKKSRNAFVGAVEFGVSRVTMQDGTADPDGDRMRRWATGDRFAFEEIVRAWEVAVGRFVYRLVLDVHLAADVTQEVFLRVYRAGAKYRDVGQFKTWLFQIALNLCRDAARSRSRKRTQPLPQELPMPSSEVPHDRFEIAEVVSAALAALPEPLREVVVLRHYEGLSFEAMGRMLGVPTTTLKSRFAVAMQQLAETLTPKFT